MKIIFHKNFKKEYQALRQNEQRRADERLSLFWKDQFHPLLNNHPLKGNYSGYRSINIGGDLRAIYKYTGKDGIIFVIIGKHNKLYN